MNVQELDRLMAFALQSNVQFQFQERQWFYQKGKTYGPFKLFQECLLHATAEHFIHPCFKVIYQKNQEEGVIYLQYERIQRRLFCIPIEQAVSEEFVQQTGLNSDAIISYDYTNPVDQNGKTIHLDSQCQVYRYEDE